MNFEHSAHAMNLELELDRTFTFECPESIWSFHFPKLEKNSQESLEIEWVLTDNVLAERTVGKTVWWKTVVQFHYLWGIQWEMKTVLHSFCHCDWHLQGTHLKKRIRRSYTSWPWLSGCTALSPKTLLCLWELRLLVHIKESMSIFQ